MSQLQLIKMNPVASSVTTMDAKWDESKHPRKHGQFAPKGSGTTGKTGGKKSSSKGGKKHSNTRFSKKDLQEMKRGTSWYDRRMADPKYADRAASRVKKLLQKYAKNGLVM